MHSEIGNITRYYPFKHSAYRQYFNQDDLADSIRKLRQRPELFFELSDNIRTIRDKSQPNEVELFLHAEYITTRRKVDLIGLMSFSSNGYVRQAALEALTSFKSVDVLPYIILRLQDWVDPVRQLALSVFQSYAERAALENWEQCALLINRITDRSHGSAIKSLVQSHLRSRFSAKDKANWFLNTDRDMRRLLWGQFTDQDLSRVATPAFITSESDPKLASDIFQRLLKTLPREEVIKAGISHASNRIRYASLQALSDIEGEELKSVTEKALSDRSANVRDLARFLYRKHFELNPKDHFQDFDIRPDDPVAPVGYVLGWMESSDEAPEKFLAFYKHSKRGKIRGAALMAYARVAGYRDDIPDLIINALENGSHARDVAAKLIKMGWASGISDALWNLADRETDLYRHMRLLRLAAQSDMQNALLPALRRAPDALPAIRDVLLDIVSKFSRMSYGPDLSEAEKTEGRALVKKIDVGRQKKEQLNFLFI